MEKYVLTLPEIVKRTKLSTSTIDSILSRSEFAQFRTNCSNGFPSKFCISEEFKNLFKKFLEIRMTSGRCLAPVKIKYRELVKTNLKVLDK